MAGRLAVDFGTSNTVVAVWDEARREGVPLAMPDYGVLLDSGADQSISVIPSLIHYAADERRWLGRQVQDRNLASSERTFSRMKLYIGQRSPRKQRIDGVEVSPFDAGRDFLSTVLAFAAEEAGSADDEMALTVPVEAYEHYADWLSEVADQAGLPRFRLIDEASAAALGYGAHIQPGHVYLVIDFGGGTLDVAVVRIEEDAAAVAGRRCRVLGKAGTSLGGTHIDTWLYQEVLRRAGRNELDADVRELRNALLLECEHAKQRLSDVEQTGISVLNPHTGAVLTADLTRAEFEDLLDHHQALTSIDQAIRRALNASRERGYDEDSVQAVLLVGGSSRIPCVQRTIQRIFGRERVLHHRPLDAVARGAAAFVAGVDFFDHIQHDYAVRRVDQATGNYDYYPIVKRGTPYPTDGVLTEITVTATHEGQRQLGLAIFEIGERRRRSPSGAVELVFDPAGGVRVMPVSPHEEERRTLFWMNEQSPTFLIADPPACRGEQRFRVAFAIDGNKRLMISARDLITNRMTHLDFPVVKLS